MISQICYGNVDLPNNKYVNEQIEGFCKICDDGYQCGKLIAKIVLICLQFDFTAPPIKRCCPFPFLLNLGWSHNRCQE